MYAFLDLKYIEPEQRLDRGEIEASAKKVKNN
jgi:DNA polymerase/3'-5' exonuclease PolX